MAIKDYNVSAILNASIGGTNIAEGAPAAGMNDAVRQLMADLAADRSRLQTDVEVFGGGTGVADNTAAIIAALAALHAAGGGVLQLQAGNYQVASATLGGTGISLPSNVTVRGMGVGLTTITVTGTTACYLFYNGKCASNQRICDLTAIGNNTASNNSDGSFYWVNSREASSPVDPATADVRNCVVENVRLENFGGDQWIWFTALNSTYSIYDVGVRNLQAKTYSGNARGPTNIGIVSIIVSTRAEGGLIEGFFVDGLTADADYVKTAVGIFGRTHKIWLGGLIIRNAFQGYSNADKGGYAVFLYGLNATDNPTDVVIYSPIIINPFSCGIYIPDSFDVQIISPRISGQEDTADGTIPKGAIALNGPNNVRIINADLSGNAINFAINTATSTTFAADMDLQVIGGSGRGASDTGVKIRPGGAYSTAGGIHFYGYRDTGSAEGAVKMFPSLTLGFVDVTFESFDFGSTKHAINLNASTVASHSNAGIVFRNGRISAAGAAYYSFAATGTNTGKLTVDNITFDSTPDFHVVMGASTAVEILRNHFSGTPSTANMELSGTQGIMQDNVAANGLALVSTTGTALGESAPTWAAGPGAFVQNRVAGWTGTTPNKYCLLGWMWESGTTWSEVQSGKI